MGEVEEKRSVAVGLDHSQRFIGPPVGEIAARLERRTAIIGRGKAQRSPKELVDRIKIELGVDDARVILGQIQPAVHQQAFVKPLRIWQKILSVPQMPFADMHGVIAAPFEQFGNRDFRPRQPLVLKRQDVVIDFGIDLKLGQMRFLSPRSERGQRAGHAIGRGREFEPGACGISPGHQHRTRRRASAGAGIGLRKDRALRGQLVDIGGRHSPSRNTAAKGRDVIIAQIIEQDEHNVWRTIAKRRGRFGRPLVPLDDAGRPSLNPVRLCSVQRNILNDDRSVEPPHRTDQQHRDKPDDSNFPKHLPPHFRAPHGQSTWSAQPDRLLFPRRHWTEINVYD